MNTNPKTPRELIQSLNDYMFAKPKKQPKRKKNEGIWTYLMRISK